MSRPLVVHAALVVALLAAGGSAATAGCRAPRSSRDDDAEAFVTTAGTTTSDDREGGWPRGLTRPQVVAAVADKPWAELAPLGTTFQEAARVAPAAVLDLYLGTDAFAAARAKEVLSNLDGVAVVPILESNHEVPNADVRAWLARQAVTSTQALRKKVVRYLERMLDDEAPIWIPRHRALVSDLLYRESRVRDLAYLLLQDVQHPELRIMDEFEARGGTHHDIFLGADPDFRDAEIARARATGDWGRKITRADVARFHATPSAPPGARGETSAHPF
jgi:hypothetical protein